MQLLKYIIPILLVVTISCTSDDDPIEPINEIEGLTKVQEISNNIHTIELFTESGKLMQGYNDITLRIMNKNSKAYIQNASINWKPMMHMTSMMHSCPKSSITKMADKETLYNGFIIFQMAENADEKWDLTFNYTIDGSEYEAKAGITVPATEKKVVASFMGTDGARYVVALVAPKNPEVKVNDIVAGIYKMENMMTFPEVTNYKLMLDPRMPSMGNHSSPNNEDLTYDAASKMYKGKLSLTMTGYWKLNLMLVNNNSEMLKGEEVTDENESSSLFLELEF
ncbi:hypothetical protein [Aureibaculum conchae]|uniref:hypothetical protein n=1 Tax=Aureibaculum sp. 2308TA14-22 TaxID=3108392 RepID=UPI0033949777